MLLEGYTESLRAERNVPMADDCIWKLVYRHDENGAPIRGSLNDLVNAIRSGADVQIRYFRQSVEWHRRCLSVSINGRLPNAIVAAVITDIPDTEFQAGVGRTFSAPPAYEWQIFNTSGRRETIKFDKKNSDAQNRSDSIGITWYARGYDSIFADLVTKIDNLAIDRLGSGDP